MKKILGNDKMFDILDEWNKKHLRIEIAKGIDQDLWWCTIEGEWIRITECGYGLIDVILKTNLTLKDKERTP
jgi:hypothetical protein